MLKRRQMLTSIFSLAGASTSRKSPAPEKTSTPAEASEWARLNLTPVPDPNKHERSRKPRQSDPQAGLIQDLG